jgi:hypothetical protein
LEITQFTICSSFLSAFVDAVGSAFLCFLSLASAMIITLGFGTWCGDITQRFEELAVSLITSSTILTIKIYTL